MSRGVYPRTIEYREKIRKAHLGKKHSPETRQRMSQAHLGNKSALGSKHSPEAREKRRQATLGNKYALGNKNRLGHSLSPETREKLRQANLGKVYGPPSAETREKIRQAHLGRLISPEWREKIRQARLRRVLPTKMTSIECLLRTEFKKRRLKFEMHKTMFGRFQPDFVFEQAHLIVQADGDYWHALLEAQIRDMAFNSAAAAEGWSVWRFGEQEIRMHASLCAKAVARFVKSHKTCPHI